MARIQRSNCRVYINGVDISDSVTDVQYSVEFEPDNRRNIRFDVTMNPQDQLTVLPRRGPSPDIVEWDDVLAQANSAFEERHRFVLGPELGICADCDMWPEHHNHGSRGSCICQVCKPDADQLPDDQHVVFNGDDRYRERR